MTTYITKRILSSIPILLGITLISFAVIHLAPGKPTDLQTQLNIKVSYEARVRIEKLYGLDKPLPMQYLMWLKRFVLLDFGRSFVDDRPVLDKIKERIPITLIIELLSILLILAVAIPIGVTCAVRENSLFDKTAGVFVFIGFAMPTFWLALILMSLLCVKAGLLPVSGIASFNFGEMNFPEKVIDLFGADEISYISTPTGKVDTVFDCAGLPMGFTGTPVLQQAISMLKENGKAVVVAIFEKPPEIDYNLVVRKGITIHGSWAWVPEEFKASMELIGSGKIDRKPLITHRFPIDEAKQAYETQLRAEEAVKVMIIP